MFKQLDCHNIRETSQRVVAESFSPNAFLYPGREGEEEGRKRRMTLKSMFDFGGSVQMPIEFHGDTSQILGHIDKSER